MIKPFLTEKIKERVSKTWIQVTILLYQMFQSFLFKDCIITSPPHN